MEYRICSKCIMDTTDPDITFDEMGVCNHCHDYEKWFHNFKVNENDRNIEFDKLINKIKKAGRRKKYDSIIGLSGGVDSSYLAYIASKSGLRPMAVHLDNGWNSEEAVNNIKNIISRLNFDLYTHVIDWEEFKDLQRSFFKASVVDIEILTDQAITTIMLKLARKYNIHYVLSGTNKMTEFIMPKKWVFYKLDYINVRAIQKRFGSKKIKTFPLCDIRTLLNRQYSIGFKLKMAHLLNYVDYNKAEAKKLLMKEFGWKDYGGKHYESVFTKFYQAYYLPQKFNIDKRRAHLSTLINAGQITREQALLEIDQPLYGAEELKQDKSYVLKKLSFSEDDFNNLLTEPVKSHLDYPSIYRYIIFLEKLKNKIKK